MAKSISWEVEEDNIIKSLMKYVEYSFIENKKKNIFGLKSPSNFTIIIMDNMLELRNKYEKGG